MAFEGTLKDFSLPDIVQLITLQRKTGVLTLEGPDDAATLFFQDGAVVWARSRAHPLNARVRRVLRLRGLVTESELVEADRVQAETGQRLGAVLIERQVLPEEQWHRAMALEVREILYRVVRWREGTYRFETRTVLDLPEGRIAPLATETFLLESFRQLDEWPLIARRIPRLEGVFFLARPNDDIDLSSLSPEECRVLELLDGRMRAADVVDGSGLGEFEACKALASLMEAGIVALAPDAATPAAPRRVEPGAVKRVLVAGGGRAMWALLAVWLALNLLLFRPWAWFLGPPPSADTLGQVRARADLVTLGRTLDQYFAEVGSFPPDLAVLVRRGMVGAETLRDPWGRPYRYEVRGDGYLVRSEGLGDLAGQGPPRPGVQ